MPRQVHLCILTGQILPSLLSLTSYRPERIALAVPQAMQAHLQPMITALHQTGLVQHPADIIILPDMPSSNYTAMRDWANQHLDLLRQCLPQHRVVINITGASPLVTQALSTACQEHPEHSAILYCDTRLDTLEWLSPQSHREPLNNGLLNSSTLLQACGLEPQAARSDCPQWQEAVMARAELTHWLATKSAHQLACFMTVLRQALQPLDPQQLPAQAEFRQPASSPAWREALARLQQQALLSIDEPLIACASPHLLIHSPEALHYLRGGWLEEYLWLCFRETGLQDVHCGQQSGTKATGFDEMEVVVGYRNRLLVVACTAADLRHQEAYEQVLNTLNKWAQQAGELLPHRWLVATSWPHHDPDLQQRLRLLAQAHNVTLIEPTHWADLPQRILRWKKPTWPSL